MQSTIRLSLFSSVFEYGYIKHLLLQCITTSPGRVLHVARAQNRPVAAAIDILSLSRPTSLLSRSLKVKSVETRLASCDLVSKPTTAGSTISWEVALKRRAAVCLYMHGQ